MGNCWQNEKQIDPKDKKIDTKRSKRSSTKKSKDSKVSKFKNTKKKEEDSSTCNTLNLYKIENKQIIMSSDNNNDSTITSLVPFNSKRSYLTESSLVKSINNDSIWI